MKSRRLLAALPASLAVGVRRMPTVIASQAFIDPRAEIGQDVEIGPFCVIGPDVTLEGGCRLLNSVTIIGKTSIGRDNVFFPNSVIGTYPQDKKFKVGFIYVGPKDDYGYNYEHDRGRKAVEAAMKDVEVMTAENIPETAEVERYIADHKLYTP